MATFCRLIDWLQKHVNVLTKICVVPLGPARRKRSEAGRMPEPRAKRKCKGATQVNSAGGMLKK